MHDLLYILQRRRVSFERWCDQEGVRTQEDFVKVSNRIEQSAEYFISQEMKELAKSLPLKQETISADLTDLETPKPKKKLKQVEQP